jgi:xanthine dehydrogenase YagR molybdenum-binding subunit
LTCVAPGSTGGNGVATDRSDEKRSSRTAYPIAVNADIHQIDVDFIDEPDPLINPVAVKGLGEVAMVGVSAAIGNAVFHATGTRFRRLPIHLEDVLASL